MKELEYPLDGDGILLRKRGIKRRLLQEMEKNPGIFKKIAILGGSTTSEIKDCLELFLLNAGIAPEFYESDYNRYFEDAVFGNRELEAFAPDLIYIHTSNRNIQEWPEAGDSREKTEEKAERVYGHFEQAWEILRDRFHCAIIQNNMELPYGRVMGNIEAWDCRGRVHYIEQINQKFHEYADRHSNFLINDIHYLSSWYGLEKWADPFYWYMYKYSLNVSAIPALANNVANIIKALYGKSRKAVVLDLDHTLWGGVIGEEGAANIKIGQETPEGQAYHEFQEYIKRLKDMGILLNICSKNEREAAMEGLNHADSVLKPEDFLVLKINWEPKSKNIREISEELNILPESMVFIDDNPAEREIVRQQEGAVAVPEMSRVESYIKEIDGHGYFETVRLSSDDINRNRMYQSNLERTHEAKKYDNYEDYLLSLEMRASIRPFDEDTVPRITQLVNKSNQFNMTTKRYTQAEISEIAKAEGYITLYGRLKDKFGDNGVVSVVIGRVERQVCHIELWLMSCRVLKRDMELAMLDRLVEECGKRRVREIRGYYYPTEKNRMAAGFYEEQNFKKAEEDHRGNTVWAWDMADVYQGRNRVIKVEDLGHDGGTDL